MITRFTKYTHCDRIFIDKSQKTGDDIMRKAIVLFLSFIIITIFISCDRNLTELTTVQTQTTSETEDTLTTYLPTTQIITSTTTIESTTLTTEEFISLKTTELSIHSIFYGNTNGNAINNGLVVYDKTNHLHYYALGSVVYSYDPATDETEILFNSGDGGFIRNLCLSDTYLYYVSTANQWMMKYNLETQEIGTVYEGETYYISRYFHYVYMDMTKIDIYGTETRGMGIFDDDDQEFFTQFSGGVTNMNISGTMMFYNTNYGTTINVMASTFNGKTSLRSFSTEGFTQIQQLLLIRDGSIRELALIATTSSETALYIYNATDDTLEKIASGSGLHSLNFDGSNLYFINGGGLFSYNLETQELVKIVDVFGDSQYIFVINHWLYFSNTNLSVLFRIDPDTTEVTNISID